MHKVNVLLVEDNDFTRSTVAASLRAEGCTVVAAVNSARDAMSAAADHDIDCAVIDLQLGLGPNGIDVAHALRKLDPDVGLVILTSYEDPRLHPDGKRPLPEGTEYLVKNDVHSTAQLRERIDIACGLIEPIRGRKSGAVPLTDAQTEVLRLVAEGLTNAEIARRKVVSERSVEATVQRIARRLDIEPAPGENARVLLTHAYYSMIGGTNPN